MPKVREFGDPDGTLTISISSIENAGVFIKLPWKQNLIRTKLNDTNERSATFHYLLRNDGMFRGTVKFGIRFTSNRELSITVSSYTHFVPNISVGLNNDNG